MTLARDTVQCYPPSPPLTYPAAVPLCYNWHGRLIHSDARTHTHARKPSACIWSLLLDVRHIQGLVRGPCCCCAGGRSQGSSIHTPLGCERCTSHLSSRRRDTQYSSSPAGALSHTPQGGCNLYWSRRRCARRLQQQRQRHHFGAAAAAGIAPFTITITCAARLLQPHISCCTNHCT